jgi:serine/threonine protein kinase
VSGRIEEFGQRGCDVLAVSTDSIETHQRWLTTAPAQGGMGSLEFPLASDADGAVCKQYGVYVDRQHLALRGLFIIDPNGVLQYQVVHSLSVGRSTDEVLRVLEALQMGGLCPGERGLGEPSIDASRALGPHRVIGQYQIEATLGRGAFGTVFRARDTLLDRTVALKVLRREANDQAEMLLAEARAAAALNHPNVCLVYAADTANGAAMIVMEYVAGEPLSARIAAGPLSHEAAAALGRQIAWGMAAAHAAGVVHGDLKPANLIVTPDDVVKIMDFGLARRISVGQRADETVAWAGAAATGISGTPGYMAPELARGEPATPASDVFALGLVLYEMLSGKPALSGNGVLDVLRRVEEFDAAPFVAAVPAPFSRILASALARDSSQRSITMDEIAQELA